jgi:hypothetical protein
VGFAGGGDGGIDFGFASEVDFAYDVIRCWVVDCVLVGGRALDELCELELPTLMTVGRHTSLLIM